MMTKNPKQIALIEYLRSYETIKNVLDRVFFKKEDSDILNFMKDNNSNIFDLQLEDSFEFLQNDLKSNFKEICDYLAKRHYTLSNNYKIYLNKDYLDELKLLQSDNTFTIKQPLCICK